MNMNALKEIISDLVDKEKTSAIKNHGYALSDYEGLHYADLQKAETLKLYGRIER